MIFTYFDYLTGTSNFCNSTPNSSGFYRYIMTSRIFFIDSHKIWRKSFVLNKNSMFWYSWSGNHCQIKKIGTNFRPINPMALKNPFFQRFPPWLFKKSIKVNYHGVLNKFITISKSIKHILQNSHNDLVLKYMYFLTIKSLGLATIISKTCI